MSSLPAFFGFTYVLSWVLWPAAAALRNTDSPGLVALSVPIHLLGVFTPSLVALALTYRADDRAGTRTLLGRIAELPTDLRWYLFAAGFMAVIKLAVAVLHHLITGAWPRFGETPWYLMVVAMLFSTPVQAGEEIGWRGYALPRLAGRLGLPRASIVLGVIWASWHLPFFFMEGTDSFHQSFPVYLLQVTAISVVMAWLYWRTNGSLLLVMLLHAAINNTKDIVPSAVTGSTQVFGLSASLPAWLTLALLWLCAGYFLLGMRGANLSRAWQPAPPLGTSTA